MPSRRAPRSLVVAVSVAFALCVLAGTGLGIALTPSAPPVVALGS